MSHDALTEEVTSGTIPDSPKRDFRKEVTEQIIEMLEHGTAPWQKPWTQGAAQMPFNPTTGHSYRGGNALYLMASGLRSGYDDPRWLTYKQASEQGWQVKRGERGTHIEYWQFDNQSSAGWPRSDADGPELAATNGGHKRNLLRRVYTVFNAQQIEGIPAHQRPGPKEWEVAAAGEQILQNSGAAITHDQRGRAFYNRASDSIHLPPRDAFENAAGYYGTALHELAHWTGHPTRLNRATLTESYKFGDTNYAKEELRAELASVFLAAERGVPHDPSQHAAYVQSWIKCLKDDKNEFFHAARDAHKAADFILSFERTREREAPPSQELHRETSEHVAELDRGTGTVNITEKQTATENRNQARISHSETPDTLAPAKMEAERIFDGEVEGGRLPSAHLLEESHKAAVEEARRLEGEPTRTYDAATKSGSYRGKLIGETDHHFLQKISSQAVVLHAKGLLPESASVGQKLVITYSQGEGSIRKYRDRTRGVELSR